MGLGMRGNTQFNETGTLKAGADKKRGEMRELDYLTGILKKSAAESRMTSAMNRNRSGALVLCDVNRLRQINDQYGHPAGDECLKEAAQVLTYMIRENDILGRYGGDHFLIFIPNCQEIQQAQEICERIEKRFRMNGGKGKNEIAFSVTAVSVLRQPGDTCRSLLERADAELRRRKSDTGGRKSRGQDHYVKDARRIRKDLIEQIRKPGAYCQDYETFKGIYRFLERGIIRSGLKACAILISVVDGQGRSLQPGEKDDQMERLGEDIHSTLRIGDVYTRYSSSQYLVLVIDTTEGQGDRIAERIRGKFQAGGQENDILVHHCYALQPARIVELTEQDHSYAAPEKLKRRSKA
ncbi:GGDEF domain-containing protein [Schaedlerella arabinosiphila]|uniref:GGDEF domain-containing protein n=2 Tax=Schaedlerella arabinosiphila TaxID=2044587 RepID=A0A426DIL9_9FIRM|nr:GGDEF domain-containing protein [Schaedlerella arabinosiphila]